MGGAGGLAAAIGRGLVAGTIGTAAMNVSSTGEQRLRERDASAAPSDAAMKVLGIESFCDAGAKDRFSNAVHWGYGTSWGVPRALLAVACLGPAAATAAPGGAPRAGGGAPSRARAAARAPRGGAGGPPERGMRPARGAAPPLWEWGAA